MFLQKYITKISNALTKVNLFLTIDMAGFEIFRASSKSFLQKLNDKNVPNFTLKMELYVTVVSNRK